MCSSCVIIACFFFFIIKTLFRCSCRGLELEQFCSELLSCTPSPIFMPYIDLYLLLIFSDSSLWFRFHLETKFFLIILRYHVGLNYIKNLLIIIIKKQNKKLYLN